MKTAFSKSPVFRERHGTAIPGATDRQARIAGFEQAVYSTSSVLCIGAGGLISHVAPTLCRKGIDQLKIFDRDVVEESNLNRQRFYPKDVGRNKAHALARNLVAECIHETSIQSYALSFEQAVESAVVMRPHVAVCGVDNNPTRVAVSQFFRRKGIPVIFMAVSADADHGYVLIQENGGPCIGCLLPDITDDDRYPCPGTPAVADILQAVGALAVYALDTLLMARPRTWNYRSLSLQDGSFDAATTMPRRENCSLCDRKTSSAQSGGKSRP